MSFYMKKLKFLQDEAYVLDNFTKSQYYTSFLEISSHLLFYIFIKKFMWIYCRGFK